MNFATDWPATLLWAQQSQLDSVPWIKWILVVLVVFLGIFPGIVAYMVWGERKVAARFQDRIGPNRVGPLGLLQPIADAIKLIIKEDIVPRSADQFVHLLAPVIMIVGAFLGLAVIPFGIGLAAVNPPSGLLYLIAASSLSSLGIFLAGWSSRNKYSLLGAMRAVAQLVSYEIPQVLATVPVVLWAGSLSMVTIFEQQLVHGWNIASPPGFLAFMIMTIASIAEVNRAPFDLPEAESEIIAGYHTEYSGMRFGLFFLAEYLSIFGVSCLGTALFLGGGALPFLDVTEIFGRGDTWGAFLVVNSIFLASFAVKVSGYIFAMFWIRATLPRLRVDRLMNFAWKFLVPLCLINILIAAIWYECVIRPGSPNYLLGWAITGPLVILAYVGMAAINRLGRPAVPNVAPKPYLGLVAVPGAR
ncbi:NADH-quinone oxidoreductase subunit NuoH [Isosphaeraceae bacterium EP7]